MSSIDLSSIPSGLISNLKANLIGDAIHGLLGKLGSLLGQLEDGTRLYRLEGEGEVGSLKIQAWHMREALSQCWNLEILCLSQQADIDVSALTFSPVTLWTRLADGSEHPRVGLITDASSEDADGGLVRYRLHVQPWLALLDHHVSSRTWQEQSVQAIIDTVLGAYPQAAWVWADDTADHLAQSPYAGTEGVRSYCQQYRETDLAFVQRLLAQEGLVYRFEADPSAPAGHRMVILADTTRAESCPEDACSVSVAGGLGIRFHRDASVEAQDTIQAFGQRHQFAANSVSQLSWDYQGKRALTGQLPSLTPNPPHAPLLEDYSPQGAYQWRDNGAAQRAIELQLQASEAQHHTHEGRGTVRSATAGTHFTLNDSPLSALSALQSLRSNIAGDTYLLTRVDHLGLNNLPQDLNTLLGSLGLAHLPIQDLIPTQKDQKAADKQDGTTESETAADTDTNAKTLWPEWASRELIQQVHQSGYANHFETIPFDQVWRTPLKDQNQQPLYRKPLVLSMTATIVGPNGETQASGPDEIHTDSLGRVRVVFAHQQHLTSPSSSGSAVPTSMSSTWVRVSQDWAGAGMGGQFIPRIGQEVVVTFVNGDIDRPMVQGTVYHGQGEGGIPTTPGGRTNEEADTQVFANSNDHTPSGQGNKVGGHSPAWHGAAVAALKQGGQNNAAAFSGIKTQEFGGQGYNQLVFDDTPQALRTQWMTTESGTQLNLGHIIHQADNHRGGIRGEGFELRTDSFGVIRAGQGILITTYGNQPQEPAGDIAGPLALHKQLVNLSTATQTAAKTHQTVPLGSQSGAFKQNASLTLDDQAPTAAIQAVLNSLNEVDTTSPPQKVPHTSQPIVAMAGRGGITQVAGQDQQFAAAETITVAAGRDIHEAVGGATRIHSGQAIGILAGAIKPGDKAQGKGLTIISGKDPIKYQAQGGKMQVAAKDDLSIQSKSKHVDWASAKSITIANSAGASIKIEGGNVTLECPGTISILAGTKSFVGPAKQNYNLPLMPQSICVECLKKSMQNKSALVKRS